MDNIFSGFSSESSETVDSDNGGNVMQKVRDMRENVNKQASALKERFSEQAEQVSSQLAQRIDHARGKTSNQLRNTSQKLHNLAIYVEEHDARDMSKALFRNTRDTIRRNPGRSILFGIIAGLVLGRVVRACRR